MREDNDIAYCRRHPWMLRLALLFILSVIAVTFAVLSDRQIHRKENSSTEIVRTDTLLIRDTIFIANPVYRRVRVVDTVMVELSKTDTVRIHDTVFLSLPREQKEYRDSNYIAWVSGYRPHLDSLRLFSETRQITTTILQKPKPRRWGIGIQAGYGVTAADGHVYAAPYIGVGVSWNIVHF